MSGDLVACAAYVPRQRLRRQAIAEAHGSPGGRGSRSVAAFDQDTVTLAVEAARHAVPAAERDRIRRLYFATTDPPYLDTTNATTIQAALGLTPSVLVVDVIGSVRSAAAAMQLAAESAEPTLVVLADIRTGEPGGTAERDGGDAAAALLFGSASPERPALARLLATAARSVEVTDRHRTPGSKASTVWEERFAEQVYAPQVDEAFADALEQASLAVDDVDHLVVAGLHDRAAASFARRCGVRVEAVRDRHLDTIGNPGAAQAGLLVVDALEDAEPGERIALVVIGDGAVVIVFEVGEAIGADHRGPTVAEQIAEGRNDLRYLSYLSWRGYLDLEPPRRPEPDRPSAPAAHRAEEWKFSLVGSRCTCGTVHLPPGRVCISCGTLDAMVPFDVSDRPGRLAVHTVDHLAWSPSPPLIGGIVDVDGGGRVRCQLADVREEELSIGTPLRFTFRRLETAGGIHNYFWKATTVADPGGG